jgi:DNA polymerase-4
MDAFFASVEIRDNPKLKGKPIAVGGSRRRGVVSAASYEARKFGVRSAMPGAVARRLCPQLIMVKPRFEAYKEASDIVMNIFHEYTDLVEPMSLDEAYLDVTENKMDINSATKIAKEIRKKILKQTQLTASAGVSINKFLAKVASDYNKPNGMKVITPEEADSFIEELDIEIFPGVGKVTTQKMHKLGIFKGIHLKNLKKAELEILFGKNGHYYYDIVRNSYDNPVRPHRERKSLGAERTYSYDLKHEKDILKELNRVSDILIQRLIKKGVSGRTFTLKVRYDDFTTYTRSKTYDTYIGGKDDIFRIASSILAEEEIIKPIRLLGITISNLEEQDKKKNIQLQLDFPEKFLKEDYFRLDYD